MRLLRLHNNASPSISKHGGIAPRFGFAHAGRLTHAAAELPHVSEVRGLGLMCAVEFDDSVDAAALVLAALDKGLVLNYTGAHTLRFLPPLICTTADVDAMIQGVTELL